MIQTCKYCGNANALHSLECKSCNAILRDRVVNIDLWSTIAYLIESPTTTLANIIKAENKNFIIFLSFLLILKVHLISISCYSAFSVNTISLSVGLLLLSVLFGYLLLTICSSGLKSLIKLTNNIESRFKDIFSILTYSTLPIIISLIILTPLEIAVFGSTLFTFKPSPFLLKPYFAWFFVIVEFSFFVWYLILNTIGINIYLNNRIYSFLISILQVTLLIGLQAIFLYYITSIYLHY
ncbi:MAG: hypothetical protein KF721_12665 [Ignavibacteriaceae bacterium]|nr:hypothetical protein [Ignavibacteriaceae bacterium]